MTITEITSAQQFKDILKNDLVIIDFYADWCGPCKVIAPHYHTLSQKFTDIIFCKLNVEHPNCQSIIENLAIRSMPTFIIFQNGKIDQEILGANLQKINQALNNYTF